MATAVIMPKLGNSVESTIIVAWKKAIGDAVAEGEILCEVETDKAVMEVPSSTTGTLLAILHEAGDEVPVMADIAVVGEPDEDVSRWQAGAPAEVPVEAAPATPAAVAPASSPAVAPATGRDDGPVGVSPRARNLAAQKRVDAEQLPGSGPGGRVIERDVQAALATQPKLTPVAQAMVTEGSFTAPAQGSGPGGRVTKRDLVPAGAAAPLEGIATAIPVADEVEIIPVRGVRKVIAERMLASLQTTAQLTLTGSADARGLQALRARFKASDEVLGLRGVTINDLILFAVSRTLAQHPELNALFEEGAIKRVRSVNLGVAVDTPRGLLVPTIRSAGRLSLRQLAGEAKRLAQAAQVGKVTPDELTGGTFTVTNLGAFGVESFTPVLNPPQVAILGVGNINLKPIPGADGDVEFVPHIGLSLTINHQVVDGAPAARFLQTLAAHVAAVDLLLAV